MSKKVIINLEEKVYSDEPRVRALGKIKLKINPGEFVSILGPNGCGKTTLLRLISGIDTNFNGEIIIGERVVKKPNKDCGIVFQEPRLLPWLTVEENVRFGVFSDNPKSENRINELLELLHLEEFRNAYPNQLSGGMAQKVSIARALVNNPDVLLLDEPFASLDTSTKKKLQKEIKSLLKKEKTTVLMVTHDTKEARFLSDRIIIMSKRPGKIVSDETLHQDELVTPQ